MYLKINNRNTVMTRFNTGNQIPSISEEDAYDNMACLDQAMNSSEPTWRDRFNVEKPTIDAALKSTGFMPAGFDFVTGGTLQPGDRNKAVYNPAPNGDNNWYRWNGVFPKEIAANSQPNPKDENNWVLAHFRIGIVEKEALRRTYLKAGYNLVEGSFENGAAVVGKDDCILQESTGFAFVRADGLPFNVPDDSSPDVNWISISSGYEATSNLLSRVDVVDQSDIAHNKPYPDVKIAAHRGFSFIAMENTILAFQKAKNLGADLLECDMQITSDGIPVIFHDNTTGRLMSGDVDVITNPYSVLSALTFTDLAGTQYKNEPIPRLVDVCDWLTRNDAIFLAEFKRLRSVADVEIFIDIIKQYRVLDKFVFQCNDTAILKEARKFAPKNKVAFFSDNFIQSKLDELSLMGNAIYMVQYTALNADNTIGGKCDSAGVELATYTNNNSITLRKLRRQGLKYIITDVNLGRLN